jgi:tRNA A37 threonylcarbamoyladenosine synthetase subunit TsaC/SUA5/YrdC
VSEVDLIMEGGSQGTTTSSTIVTCAVEPFVVLRPGDVTVDRVREVLAGRVEIVER